MRVNKLAHFVLGLILAMSLVLSGEVITSSKANASITNTRADAWGTLELSGSGWLGGGGVDVYSNGATAAGPSPDTYNYVNGVQSGIKWQCVELVNRLYLSKGWITSRWTGFGNQMYSTAPVSLSKQAQGNITYVNPGDVIVLDDGSSGHVGVVDSVVDNGNGTKTVNTVNQNTTAVRMSSTWNVANKTLSSFLSGYSVVGIVHAPGNGGGSTSWGGIGDATYHGETLMSGDTLYANQYLVSANVQHVLVMQNDGNLVMYHNGQVLWQSNTGGQSGNRLVMQTDGNLVMYRPNNGVAWFSGTGGYPGAYANLQSDGNFVVRSSDAAFWWTGTGGHANLKYFGSDTLTGGQQLVQGEYLRSSDGRYALTLQADGNAVLYGPGYHVLWQSSTAGAGDRLTMQTDGNLVLYALSNWQLQSYTGGNPGAYAVLQTDGNFVVYDNANFPLWLTGTAGQI